MIPTCRRGHSRRRTLAFVFACLVAATATAQQVKVFTTGTPEELALARVKGLEPLHAIGMRHGISNTAELVITRVWVDELSMAHVRAQQYFRNIPVFGGEAIVHLRSDGNVFGDTDNLISAVTVDTRPRLSPTEAIPRAQQVVHCDGCSAAEGAPQLWIVRLAGVDRLTYRIEFVRRDGGAPSLPVVFIDAHDAEVVSMYDNIQTTR